MKRIVLGTLLMTGFCFASHAQKGSILVYGDLGAHTVKQPNDDKTTEFSINPGIGYQFSDHWTAGIAGGYGHSKVEPSTGAEQKSNTYRAGGFGRYTYVFSSIFSLYGQGDVYYHGQKIEDVKSNGFGAAITPAVGINVSKGFALNIGFGGISYETIKIKDADNSTKTFDVNFGKNVTIGVSKNFGGKR
jgi:opacity protein-like surface antigen